MSVRYILVCHDKGRKLDYRAGYMLPAGWSTLLMQEVNQGADLRRDLLAYGCLPPSPVATATRLSSKVRSSSPPPIKRPVT
jgi:hypothetical protein